MKKVIRLTESDLTRIIKRVINESSLNMAEMNKYNGITADDVFDCSKKNNFDLNITMPIPNDTYGLGQSCQRLLKTKKDKDAMECAFLISGNLSTLYEKKGIAGFAKCLQNKIFTNIGQF